MLKLLKFANSLRGKFESASFDNATENPEKAQLGFLQNLLQKNAETQFGKAHRFAEIKTVKDFRRQVPVRDYEDFRPFINRIIKGEQAVLTRESPFMFTLTSGTTSEPKYIPVTREAQSFNTALMRQWLYRAEVSHKGLMSQSSVGIVSRAVEGFTSGGLPFGSASGVIYKNIPWFIRRAYTVPYAVSEIKDYDERYFVLARFALASRVSFIATPNPTTLLRLAEICAKNAEKLIRAIYCGTLGIEETFPKSVCAELSSLLTPNPQRARELERIVADKGFLSPAKAWEDLRLIGCWLGGSVGTQAAKLAEIFGDVPLRDLGYLSSEGNFTIPVNDGNSAGILAIKNAFYEFVPEAEIEHSAPTILSAAEPEIGKRYGILLTTSAGLYRYKINDIVEVTGFYNQTPQIAFIRKSGETASITGEKMHANHFIAALERISRKFNLKIEQFRAVPNFEELRYEILLEFPERVSSLFLRREILPEIDAELQHINIEYAQKRESKRLNAPILLVMKSGWANAGFRRYILDSKRDTQYKPPILGLQKQLLDEEFISEIVQTKVSETAEKVFGF